MRVAIVGAGVAGLVNARALSQLGAEVVVFEARSDVGGVWSASRGYPGQRIQNDKRSYSLSDFPMPAGYPSHPDRAQLQAYFAAFARHHRLDDAIRLSTTVTRAEYDSAAGEWRITAEGPGGLVEDRADWLIVANGTLSTPNRPTLPGRDEFERAGGRIVDASDLGDAADFTGQRLVLLGYGKSATDIAVAAAGEAAAVTVLARSVPWKLPERFGPLSFEHLVISRLGEHLMWAPYRTVVGRVMRRLDTPIRFAFRDLVARRVRAQLDLDRRGLVPDTTIQELSHLITPGFDRAVDAGQVDLLVGVTIAGLGSDASGPIVRLDDGRVLPADVLVAATGYRTDVSFLDESTRALLVDDRGRIPLHRHTMPEHAPRLLFAGWMGSFRSPIASELQSIWIAALVHGAVAPPRRRRFADRDPRHAAPTGLAIVDQDAWLRDVGLATPWSVVVAELLRPQDPAAYAGLHARLSERLSLRSRTGVTRERRATDSLRR